MDGIYTVIFEPSPADKARAFDALWAQSRHNGKKHWFGALFDYYFPRYN